MYTVCRKTILELEQLLDHYDMGKLNDLRENTCVFCDRELHAKNQSNYGWLCPGCVQEFIREFLEINSMLECTQ